MRRLFVFACCLFALGTCSPRLYRATDDARRYRLAHPYPVRPYGPPRAPVPPELQWVR